MRYESAPLGNFGQKKRFGGYVHFASRFCLGYNVKALVWRWRQICPLKINIFTLNASISTNEVSMFKLAIEVCFEHHSGLINAIFQSLGSTKSVYFFWDTRYIPASSRYKGPTKVRSSTKIPQNKSISSNSEN